MRNKSAKPKIDVKKQTDTIRNELRHDPIVNPCASLHDELLQNDP